MRKGMRGAILSGRCKAIALGALACLWQGGAAYAEDASSWRDIETKYIFGFTTGSGIGLEGEKEFTIDTHRPVRQARWSLRRDRDQIRVRVHAVAVRPDRIRRARIDPQYRRVTDLDDRNQAAFAGGFAEFRYLALERTSNNPLSVTLAFEPNVRLIDETSGDHVHNYEFETTINADLELMRNRLYAGFNLLYEPEVTQTMFGETQREATFGGSAALSLRVAVQRRGRRRGLVSPALRCHRI